MDKAFNQLQRNYNNEIGHLPRPISGQVVMEVASRNDRQPKVEAVGDEIHELYANGQRDCDGRNVKKESSTRRGQMRED
jgi:hypothetical protein